MAVSFFCPGLPEPQGSKNVGRHGQLYDQNSHKLKTWKKTVGYQASVTRTRRKEPVYEEGGVDLYLEFNFLRPDSHMNMRGELRKGAPLFHVYKPDLDKLVRAILDALTHVLYSDDRQVCQIMAEKYWTRDPEKQGVLVVCNSLTEGEEYERQSRVDILDQ